MRSVTFFDGAGAMHSTLTGHDVIFVQPTIEALGMAYVEGIFDSSYWLYGGQARKRQACPARLDGFMLRGVRQGSTIIINTQQYECAAGGDVELEFDQPGTYQVRVQRWPYLDGEYTVENPAQ